jgi:tRNA(fMet)-specific endonuclease VapC
LRGTASRFRATPMSDFDEMIAAHALALGATIVTDNTRHFERVDGLVLEKWIRSN